MTEHVVDVTELEVRCVVCSEHVSPESTDVAHPFSLGFDVKSVYFAGALFLCKEHHGHKDALVVLMSRMAELNEIGVSEPPRRVPSGGGG